MDVKKLGSFRDNLDKENLQRRNYSQNKMH